MESSSMQSFSESSTIRACSGVAILFLDSIDRVRHGRQRSARARDAEILTATTSVTTSDIGATPRHTRAAGNCQDGLTGRVSQLYQAGGTGRHREIRKGFILAERTF